MRLSFVAVALGCLLGATAAGAWSRPTHMVTAAIAYRDLRTHDPEALSSLLMLLEAHPDRGPFEVAIDRATGEERGRRMFYECARWPDDARSTSYDHPTWHYAARAVDRSEGNLLAERRDDVQGAGFEALALNLKVLRDPLAPKTDRAVSLCWVMHLVGDLHQPLHTAQLFSPAYPQGDALGSKQFVGRGAAEDSITLHWFWDDAVHRRGDVASVEVRATELSAEVQVQASEAVVVEPIRWTTESYALAVSTAYGSELRASDRAAGAPAASESYAKAVDRVAKRRVIIAGMRLAEVLKGVR